MLTPYYNGVITFEHSPSPYGDLLGYNFNPEDLVGSIEDPIMPNTWELGGLYYSLDNFDPANPYVWFELYFDTKTILTEIPPEIQSIDEIRISNGCEPLFTFKKEDGVAYIVLDDSITVISWFDLGMESWNEALEKLASKTFNVFFMEGTTKTNWPIDGKPFLTATSKRSMLTRELTQWRQNPVQEAVLRQVSAAEES